MVEINAFILIGHCVNPYLDVKKLDFLNFVTLRLKIPHELLSLCHKKILTRTNITTGTIYYYHISNRYCCPKIMQRIIGMNFMFLKPFNKNYSFYEIKIFEVANINQCILIFKNALRISICY